MISFDANYWYALRVTYNRAMMVKRYCDANRIVNFVPLEYKLHERNGVKIKKLQPVIHNLIFLKANRLLIDELKMRFPLRYIIDRETGNPIIVPEQQMLNFIAVASNYDQQIVYLAPQEIKAKIGTRVRINSGVFKGVEGTLVRIRNNKRVVVHIEGLAVVATHYIHPSMLEILEGKAVGAAHTG